IDFYGTLVTGDRDAVENTCRSVIDDHDLEMEAGELAEAWGHRFFEAIEHANGESFQTLFDLEVHTLSRVLAHLEIDLDAQKYAGMLKAYWQAPPLAADAREVLDGIDVPVCVVSNADTEDVQAAIALHNLNVTDVITSEDARSYKPHPVIFEHALCAMNVHPSRVLHIGDSLHSDIAGANAAGILTCWLNSANRIMDIAKCDDVVTDHKIRCLKELGPILSLGGGILLDKNRPLG
ncbi:MAG: HAD family hydrolase, partial [Planctomycetes bacterium]|nr:HAD family hydrolase [Planctomycetota bacterium]